MVHAPGYDKPEFDSSLNEENILQVIYLWLVSNYIIQKVIII